MKTPRIVRKTGSVFLTAIRSEKRADSENHKIFRVGLALLTRFERVAFRLGVIPSVSYRVVRDAPQYPQTRINTGFSQDRCAAA